MSIEEAANREIELLSDQITALQSEVIDQLAKVEEVEEECSHLEDEKDDIISELDDVKSERDELQTQVDELEDEVNGLKEEGADIQNDCDSEVLALQDKLSLFEDIPEIESLADASKLERIINVYDKLTDSLLKELED